jgi:O-antigen/teichoic acid export membrane protein
MLHKLKKVVAHRRASAVRYVASTGSMAVGLIAHTLGFIVLARALGASQYGVLAIITAVASFGLLWCGLGSGELMRRRVARDRSAYPEVLGHTIIILAGTTLTIGFVLSVGLAATVKVADSFAANLAIMLMFVVSNMGMFAWIGMSEQILLAHDEVGQANLVNISSGVGRAVAAVVACYGWGVHDLSDWARWHFGFYLVICIGCTVAIAAYGRPRMVILWRDLGRGLTIAAAGLFTFLRRNADVLVLGAVASPAVVGVYSVARRIVGTADVVSASLDRLVYSNLAVAGADGPEATLRLAARYAGIAALLCGLTSVALYVAAPWVPLIFGAQYADAVGITRFLAWLLILTSLHNLASDALNAAERHEKRLAAETAAGLAATALMVGLTLLYALNGMLISIYISGMLSVGALWSMLFWLARRSPCA